MTLIGLPAAIVGIIYLAIASPLIYRMTDEMEPAGRARSGSVVEESLSAVSGAGFGSRGSPRYTLEALITTECDLLIGESPLKLSTLVNPSCNARLIVRGGVVLPINTAPGSEQLKMEGGDLLLIACLAEAIGALRHVEGLHLRPDVPEVKAIVACMHGVQMACVWEVLLTPRSHKSKHLVLVEAVVGIWHGCGMYVACMWHGCGMHMTWI